MELKPMGKTLPQSKMTSPTKYPVKKTAPVAMTPIKSVVQSNIIAEDLNSGPAAIEQVEDDEAFEECVRVAVRTRPMDFNENTKGKNRYILNYFRGQKGCLN